MWVLDPVNSRELLESLRPHASSSDFEVVWCGEGWRPLVASCHLELVAACHDYRFSVIKQTSGALTFKAHPGDQPQSTDAQQALDAITEKYRVASQSTCEWCGSPGMLREDVPVQQRPQKLTLCAGCLADMATSPYPSAAPMCATPSDLHKRGVGRVGLEPTTQGL